MMASIHYRFLVKVDKSSSRAANTPGERTKSPPEWRINDARLAYLEMGLKSKVQEGKSKQGIAWMTSKWACLGANQIAVIASA
ncbi:hypothetical protein VNO78_02269 [Psophocarpus tetragonolobus]|uniref:Uncharacterized protein n=1 Tax=Psophocarpus tetragonolobus TaxID=3891 RepID=A0AAN9TAB9_PSOTE